MHGRPVSPAEMENSPGGTPAALRKKRRLDVQKKENSQKQLTRPGALTNKPENRWQPGFPRLPGAMNLTTRKGDSLNYSKESGEIG